MLTEMYLEAVILKDSLKDRVYQAWRRVRDEKDGASVVEYAILIAGLTIAVTTAAFALYTAVANRLNNAASIISTGP